MIEIEFNGKAVQTEVVTVADFLAEQQIDSANVATAVNGDFVPRTRYASTPLSASDKLEVLVPMQGG